jgi:hypothetical protein
MPFDLPAEHVLPLLESPDRARAVGARAAWDCLTASGDVPVVNLHDLEYFLWYQLPAKFLISHAEHQAIALALGDLLGDLGYRDGAAICRGPVTMHVLAEWEKDPSSGHRALRRALDESGVEPPDTDALSWGDVMGLVEAGIFHAAASALEDALLEGAFTPGARGWRRAQAAVLDRFLTTPLHSLDERTPQAAVREERRERWAERPGRPLRRAFLQAVREPIRRRPGTPADVAGQLRPLVRFLEIAAAGPTLTKAGYLPPTAVRELVAELGWSLGHRPTRSEADSPEVMTLRELAKEAALVRRTRGRLTLTPVGRRALAEPAVLWDRVVRTLAAGEDFAFAVRELVLARLLGGPSERGLIEREILPVLSEAGWRPSDGTELTRDMVSFKLWDAIRAMDLLGMIEVGEWPDRGLSLTDLGAATARAVLWHRATAPRQ